MNLRRYSAFGRELDETEPDAQAHYTRFTDAQYVIDRLRLALYRYGGHIPPCPGRPCNCGFLAEWQFAALPASIADAAKIALLKPAPSDSISEVPK